MAKNQQVPLIERLQENLDSGIVTKRSTAVAIGALATISLIFAVVPLSTALFVRKSHADVRYRGILMTSATMSVVQMLFLLTVIILVFAVQPVKLNKTMSDADTELKKIEQQIAELSRLMQDTGRLAENSSGESQEVFRQQIIELVSEMNKLQQRYLIINRSIDQYKEDLRQCMEKQSPPK